MKTVIYIRNSKSDKEPRIQLGSIYKIAPQEAEIYEEKKSAWKNQEKRTVFNEIINLIKKNKVSNIYVFDLDRIYRNRKNLVSFFKLCKIYKTKIHSYRQDWINNINNIEPPFNDIMFDFLINILGWIAEDESNKKSERIKNAVKKKNNTTISYKGNKWGRKKLSPQKTKYIRDYICNNPNMSLRQIAKNTNSTKSTVYRILSQNHT